MAEKQRKRLRTISEISEAYEDLYNKQMVGDIDSKAVDGINTTLKGVTYLNAKLKMDAAKLVLQARIKKISLPDNLLPDIS